MLDDGRLTDNKGRVVSFRNALLVLTSNVGSRAILDVAQRQQAAAGGGGGGGGGFFGGGGANDAGAAADSEAYRAMRSAVKKELGGRFRPEFLNRLDEVIVFSSLDRGEVSQVAQLMLDEVATRSADNGLPLRFSDTLKATLVEQGFSSTYGARPLRRAVQRVIEDPVAEAVLDDFAADGQLDIDVSRDGALLLKNKRGQQRTVEMRQGMGIEDDLGEEPAAAPGRRRRWTLASRRLSARRRAECSAEAAAEAAAEAISADPGRWVPRYGTSARGVDGRSTIDDSPLLASFMFGSVDRRFIFLCVILFR